MAESYNRRVNLYININGKEVKNDIKSIKAEMQHLVNAQAKMTIGSQEYQRSQASINKLNGILKEHRNQLNSTANSWFSLSKAADKFNKYFGMATAALASFAGVSLAVKSAIDVYNQFDDKVADVMKTTGLTKDQVLALNEELKKIDTRTSQQELLDLAKIAGKLGISAEKDVLGFVRAADQIRVALTEDLGGDVEDSINQIGKLTDIFKLTDQFGIEQAMLKTGSAINALGAAGTANEGYLVEFAKRVAGIAPSAGVSIQNVLGLGTTLDELGQTAEVAGTVYSQIMGGMFKDTATYANLAGMSLADFTNLMNTDANEAFIKVLEGAKGSGQGFGELAANLDGLGLDGARATSVLGVLANNIEKLREKQALSNAEFEKGTSLTNEFNTKNNTAQASLEKAKKAFTDLQQELGQRLSPAYTSIIGKSTLLLRVIGTLIEFLFKYGGVIVWLTSSVLAYSAAAKIMYYWENRKNAAMGIGWAVAKLQTFWTTALRGATLLAAAAQALFSGNIGRASAAMRVFNTVTKLNPIGLIVSAIMLAIGAFTLLTNKSKEVTAAQKAMTDVEIQAQQSIVEQKRKVEDLLKIAQDEKLSLESRKKALAELNSISPEYFGNLTLQSVKTDEARKASDLYSEALIKNARVIAAQSLMVELEKKNIEDTLSGKNKELTFLEKVKSGAGINLFKTARNEQILQAAANEKAAKSQAEYNEKMQAYQDIISKNQDPNKPKITGSATSPETTTSPVDNSGGGKGKSKFDLTKEAMIDSFNEEQNLLKSQLLQRNLTQQQYDDEQYALVLAHLLAMRELYAANGQTTTELDGQIVDKQLEGQKKIDDAFALYAEVGKVQSEENKSRDQEIIDSMAQFQQEYESGLDAENQAYVDKNVAKQKSDEETSAAQEEARKAQIENALQAGIAAVEEAKTLKDAAKGVLNVIREQIKARLMQAVAIQVGKVLAKVPFPFNLAAAAVAAGAVTFLFNKIVPKFEEGGFTAPGSETEPAGIVHKGEWVAPADMVKNPQTGAIIESLERYRLNRVAPNPALVAGRIPFATGGYVSTATTFPTQETNEMNAKLLAAIDRLMSWKPKVYTEDIKKGLDTLDSINKNRNL